MAANMKEHTDLGGDAIRVEQDDKGILTLTLDMPGRSANVLNDQFSVPFAALIERIESDDSVTGVILTSGKKNFMVGADIDGLFAVTDPAVALQMAGDFKAMLRRLECCGKPVVAALNG